MAFNDREALEALIRPEISFQEMNRLLPGNHVVKIPLGQSAG